MFRLQRLHDKSTRAAVQTGIGVPTCNVQSNYGRQITERDEQKGRAKAGKGEHEHSEEKRCGRSKAGRETEAVTIFSGDSASHRPAVLQSWERGKGVRKASEGERGQEKNLEVRPQIAARLREAGLSAEQLSVLAKGDRSTARLARRAKTATLARAPWLAKGLQMGGSSFTRVDV